MKRTLLVLIAVAMCVAGFAQKTVIKTESFSATQARMLEVTAKSYVRPLVVDLVVKKGQTRMIYKHSYKRSDVDVAMGGSLDNLRSRVIYDATADPSWNCDAVVGPTFKIELSADGSQYDVEMKGFPANFDPNSWHPIGKGGEGQDDYKWIEKSAQTSDFANSGAVINNVKK